MIDYNNAEVYMEDTLVGKYIDGVGERLSDNIVVKCRFKETLAEFLESRVMPRCAWRDSLREFYGIDGWNPLEICKRTHGMMPHDFLWLKFKGESADLNWQTVQQQIW